MKKVKIIFYYFYCKKYKIFVKFVKLWFIHFQEYIFPSNYSNSKLWIFEDPKQNLKYIKFLEKN